MHKKIISILIIFFFVCSGVCCVSIPETEAGVFSRSVTKVAARKAAARKAAHKTTQKKAAKRAARKKAPKKEKNYKEIAAHDRHRDNNTTAKPLEKPRTVRRYTSSADAKYIKAKGVPANTHMTARIPKGRAISAGKAKNRYGLKDKPDTRLTIQIPKGHPTKKNKVIGGEPGWGEITSPKRIPPKNVVKVDRL